MINWLTNLIEKRKERKIARFYVQVLKQVPKELNKLKKEGTHVSIGLCSLIGSSGKSLGVPPNKLFALRKTIIRPSVEWEHFSGDTTFPVPLMYGKKSAQELLYARYISDSIDNWDKETEYGRLRWDLYEFLLNFWKKEAGEL